MTILPAGSDGTLIEVADPAAVHHVARWVASAPFADSIEDVIPAARTVLVIAATDVRSALRDHLARMPPWRAGGDQPGGAVTTIPLRYDGPDLTAVCEALGLTTGEFVAAHSATEFTVSYFGFTPGFPYLTGMSARLSLPRRDVPRTTVAAGSVGIAGQGTVIYPGGTPGGWNLVATSHAAPLWDIDRNPPNSLAIGDRVVFEPIP